MGLSNFPSPVDGVIPMLVMNTVMSVALVKNKLRSVLEAVGGGGGEGGGWASDNELDDDLGGGDDESRERRVSITRYGSLCGACEEAVDCCCVCLSRFKAEEEVSELSCRHFFHKACLDKWFDNQHLTCPLCRSIM